MIPFEIVRVFRAARRAEGARKRLGPLAAVQIMRRAGNAAKARGAIERAQLRRVVWWIDRAFPGGPNCYRRALLEIAVDRGAAQERLMLGFRSGGNHGSGHAWLESEPSDGPYDAIVSV
jgi:hypothetical protein